MSDRLADIRARLTAFEPDKPFVTVTDVPLAGGVPSTVKWQATIEHAPADIAWLLDEVERLRHTNASSANPLCDEPAKQGVTKRERPDAK